MIERRGAQQLLRDPKVFAERVDMVYRACPTSLAASFIVSIVILYFRLADDGALSIEQWWAALTLVSVLRYWLVWRYRVRARAEAEAPLWARRFILSSLTVGLAWGYCGAAMMPADRDSAFLMTLIGAAISTVPLASLAPLRLVYYAFSRSHDRRLCYGQNRHR